METPFTSRKTSRWSSRRFVLVSALVGIIAPTVRAEVTETFSQTYTLAPGGTVSLANLNGSARLVAAPEGSQELRVEGTKRGRTAAELQAVTIETDAKPDAVSISTRYPKYDWSGSGHASVDYTLTIPHGARLQNVKFTNGSLTLESLTTAAVDVNCVNGKLLVRDLAASGPVKLGDVNGALEVSLRTLPADGQPVEIKTVNGTLRVTLPADAAGVDLSAKTVNGSIENDAGLTEKEESHVGHTLTGRLGNGSTPMRLSTVNGSIHVRTKP